MALSVLPVYSHWCWSRISGACRTNAGGLHRLNYLMSPCILFPTIKLAMWKWSAFKRSRSGADFGLDDFCGRGFFHRKTLLKVRYDFCRTSSMGRFYMHTWHVNNNLCRRAEAQKRNGRWPCIYTARPTPILFTISNPRACQTYPVRESPESLSSSAFALEEKKKKSHPNTEYFSKCFALSTNVSKSSEAFSESPNFSVLLINTPRVKQPVPNLLPCLSQNMAVWQHRWCLAAALVARWAPLTAAIPAFEQAGISAVNWPLAGHSSVAMLRHIRAHILPAPGSPSVVPPVSGGPDTLSASCGDSEVLPLLGWCQPSWLRGKLVKVAREPPKSFGNWKQR